MGGICGFVSLKGMPEEGRAVIEQMADAMQHRGPDDQGTFMDQKAALGCRRLAVIDLKAGKQPLDSEDNRYVLVFNGEIYNYRQLRRQLILKGHRFRSQTDGEVIVHLYEEMGAHCPGKLRGMFAFAIWDSLEETLFLARDRFGIKPLYYCLSDQCLVFASEIKALLKHPAVRCRVNRKALPHYLTFQYVPEPDTMFEGIYRLRPAHHLTFNAGGLNLKKYWKLHFRPDPKPLKHFIEMTDYLVREAIHLHMNSDVPRGAFLSSGIDSSLVAALLSRMETVHTFTVGCSGGRYDELPAARLTAAQLNTIHHEERIGAPEYWDNLPDIVYFQEEPVADPSAVLLYFAARLAAAEAKVVLSGEGADEAFGGYDIYREPAAVAPVQMLPDPVKRLLRHAGTLLPAGFKGKNYLRRATTALADRYFGNALIFMEDEKEHLLNRELFPRGWAPPQEVTGPFYAGSRKYDPVSRMQHLDFHTWLPGDILAKADRMTTAHSLELRVPYLDHVLVEFAATIPPHLKIRNGMTKYVLRRAAEPYLPAAVTRRPKLGFPVPIASWIREHYHPALRELFHSTAARTYFNPDMLNKMLEKHCTGQGDYGRRLWTAAVFLLWHRCFME